jgi:hypothetical protein
MWGFKRLTRNVVVTPLDQPVIGCHDASHGSQEDGVAAHKGKEGAGGTQDLPGHENPAGNDGGDHAATSDVDPAREEDRQVVGGRDGVGRDVGANLGDVPGKSGEEGGGTTSGAHVEPQADDVERVPEGLAGEDSGGRGRHDAKHAADGEDEGQERQLDELALCRLCVSREIGDVDLIGASRR